MERIAMSPDPRLPVTVLFDIDRAQRQPQWAKAIGDLADPTCKTKAYGLASFVYLTRRPFHPARIQSVLSGDLRGVIRAKGQFWLATRPDWAAVFSLAGAISTIWPLGDWWASVPPERWPAQSEAMQHIERHWAEPWGDRRQELVFIGAGMGSSAIIAALDAALFGGDEFTPWDWEGLSDPFPEWRRTAAA